MRFGSIALPGTCSAGAAGSKRVKEPQAFEGPPTGEDAPAFEAGEPYLQGFSESLAIGHPCGVGFGGVSFPLEHVGVAPVGDEEPLRGGVFLFLSPRSAVEAPIVIV